MKQGYFHLNVKKTTIEKTMQIKPIIVFFSVSQA